MSERNLHLDASAAWHGQRIRSLRERRLLTMQDLCDEVKLLTGERITLTRSAVSRWESGQRRVALRYRKALADALGTDHLLLFEDPPAGWKPTPKQKAVA